MEPGQILAGHYRLDALAGSGGMGTVFRGTDLRSGATCAIKLIRAGGSSLANERFLAEVEALSSIRHPGVVQYLDHGVESGIPFLVMEWAPGDSLADRLHQACPPLEQALAIGQRLAEALVHIHAAGIVHRDVKPRNIMLPPGSWEGARIVDFGIARSRRTATGITQTGVRLGTPRYMAPEQVLHPRKVDGRADVFSLGCVLFEMTTGQRAYRGGDEIAVLARVVIEDAPRAQRVRPALPDAVDALVAKLLSRDVRQRPTSTQAVQAIEGTRRVVTAALEAPAPLSSGEGEDTHAFSTGEDLLFDSLTGPPASSLPSSRGAFVGRDTDLASLQASMERPGTIALWGPMGIGKSRLALEALRRVGPTRTPLFVDLHRARDREAALHTISVAMAMPHDDTSPGSFAAALASRPSPILLLDGVDGVHEDLVAFAREWSSEATDATIVVVARQKASLGRAMEIRPLATDDEKSPACQLLGLRAAEAGIDASLSELAALARRLEGNPLAIELAAARITVLGAEQLARRLAQPLDLLGGVRAPADHPSTLRESLALSWDLLDEDEKIALAECSVFAADFSIETAEAVLSPDNVMDRIQSLRDKSLLSSTQLRGATRLSLYGAVREFARAKLVEMGAEERVRRAHASWVVERSESLAAQEGNPLALLELSDALPDLLAAFAFGVAFEPSIALRAVVASDPVLVSRGPLAAHVKRLDGAIGGAGGSELDPLVRMARQARGRALGLAGNFEAAIRDLDFAIEAAGGDVDAEARALLDLGVVLKRKVDLQGAERAFREVLSRRDRIESSRSLARALGNLGAVAHDRWQLDVAYTHYVEAVALAEAENDPRLLGVFLGNLAVLDQERGGLAAARHRFHRAIRALEAAGDRRLLGIYLGNLGTLELERGRADLALAAHERSRDLLAEIGDLRSEGLAHARTGATLAALGRIDEARASFAKADRLVRQDAQSAGVVRLLRAFIARAENDRIFVEASIAHARTKDAGGRTLEEASDEARAAIRMLAKPRS